MRDTVENLNFRHRQAQLAGRASSELYTLLAFKGAEVTEKARVLAVKTTGIRVYVPEFGIECAIRLVPRADTPATAAQAGKFKYDHESLSLKCGNVKIEMFQEVQVKITTKENKMRRMWLSVELVGDLRGKLDAAMGVAPAGIASSAAAAAAASEVSSAPSLFAQRYADKKKQQLAAKQAADRAVAILTTPIEREAPEDDEGLCAATALGKQLKPVGIVVEDAKAAAEAVAAAAGEAAGAAASVRKAPATGDAPQTSKRSKSQHAS